MRKVSELCKILKEGKENGENLTEKMRIKQGYRKGTVRRSSSKNTHPAGRKAPHKKKNTATS